SEALAHGASGSLLLFTDPVKFVEVANVRFLVQELRQAIGQEAIARAQKRVDRARAHVLAGQRKLEHRFARLRETLSRADKDGQEIRASTARRIEQARSQVERDLRARLKKFEAARLGESRARLEREL